jgi:hypothetical protein
MTTAIIIAIIVAAFVVGGILKLRTTAKTGMPSQDVLDRATQRARELEAAEKREDKAGGGDL